MKTKKKNVTNHGLRFHILFEFFYMRFLEKIPSFHRKSFLFENVSQLNLMPGKFASKATKGSYLILKCQNRMVKDEHF